MKVGISGKLTKAQRIAHALADAISCGHLSPGSTLDETAIAARYGVSRTPIREAIRHLTASGMLESRAHRGAVVRDFDAKQLDDMFAVMADLEGLCARGAALAMTPAELSGLADNLAEAAAHVTAGDAAGYAAVNDRFHAAVCEGAHNTYLRHVTDETRTRLLPFRRAQFEAPGRLARSLAEHRLVADAIGRRDAPAAFEAMRAHIVGAHGVVEAGPPGGGEEHLHNL